MKRFVLILSASLLLCSCGATSPTSTPTASVTLAPSAQTAIDLGQTVNFTATVANDPTNMGVTWNVSGTACSGAACGTITNSTTTTAKYNPPSSVSSALTATVTASSIADFTRISSTQVVINPAPSITTTSLSNGTVGTAYSATLAATGGSGTRTWSLASGSSLPAGLTLAAGTISGTPTAAGTSTFTVKMTDSAATPVTVSQQLSITIINPVVAVITTSLPNGVAGTAYSTTLGASGGTSSYTWSVTSGSLPGWATLNPATGVISGSSPTAGTSTFTVTATDSASATASQALGITIAPVLAITTTSLPPSAASTAYSAPALAATGGTGALTWSAMGLPAWLSLSSSGTLSGTPVATGTWNFIVKVTDSGTPAPQTASQSLSITINGASGGALAITTTTLASGVVGIPYTASVTVGGGASPYTWSIASGSLPAGLSLSTTTGAISGTPTTVATATTSNFTVTVTDSSSTPQTAGPQSLSITINPAAAACTSSGSESILSGQYAFSLSGYNGTGFLAVAGAFTADGTGKITAGEADTNGVLGVQTSAIDPSASSYSVGSDNRGCATIVTSFGTFTTRFALGNISGTTATKGRIIEFENPTSSAYIASGQILQQNAASFGSQFSGNYVFVQTGVDASSANARIGAAGVLSVSSGSITTGEMDVNEAGTPTHFTSVTGSMSSADTNGRFTMTTTWTGLPSTGNSFGYMVSSSQALLVNTNANQVLAGEVQAQTAPTGGFTNGTATGNVVVSASGANGGGSGISANVALFNANGAGSLTGTSYYDGGGTMQTHAITCTYMVATNGRIPLTGCGGGSGPVIYFFAANKGYFMSLDSDVLIGQVEPQTGAPFSVASASGNYYMGTLEVVNQNADAGVGAAALDGSGSVTTTNDFTSISSQETGNTDTSTITVNSDGTIINSNHPTVITGIVISSTKVVIMDNVNSTYPTVQVIKK